MPLSEYWDTVIDSVNAVEMNTASAVFRLVVSMLLGAFVGMERKRKGQMAGIRTFALISMGATLAMVLSVYIPQEYIGVKNGDPGRVAAQVITGIGFLGAGAIIQMKGSVRGLTTAAGIWMTATVGMAVGVGLYWLSIIATGLVLVVLTQLDRLEHKIHMGTESRTIRLKIRGIVSNIEAYRTELDHFHVNLNNVYVEYDYDENVTRLNLVVLVRETTDFIQLFAALRLVNPTLSISLANQANI